MKTVAGIRREFVDVYTNYGLDGRDMLEIPACQFIADEPAVFGTPNEDWHRRELEWYLSQSLDVNDIPPPIPKIWQSVSGEGGEINSNYGWCIFSLENGSQFRNAISALADDLYSRQAVMIYTRPSMHEDATRCGARDFICTNTVQLLVREGVMDYLVYMRSSDAVFGYKGDWAWHSWVFDKAIKSLSLAIGKQVAKGKIIWHAGSFHIYPRHIHLVQEWDDAQWEAGE